jgi:hypothetical protein
MMLVGPSNVSARAHFQGREMGAQHQGAFAALECLL